MTNKSVPLFQTSQNHLCGIISLFNCLINTVTHTDLVTIVKELVASPQNVYLSVDRHRVQIALRNLIENAIKYSRPEFGPVTLRIVTTSDAALATVEDFGLGISNDEQTRIFEPFYRIDPSRTRGTGGYGLGLSLVKKIMIAHGGDVLLESERDRGSTFTLKFPLKKAD